MAENFPNMKKKQICVFKKHRNSPKKMNPKRFTLIYITIKAASLKRGLSRQQKEKKSYIQGNLLRLKLIFWETLYATREWHEILKLQKGKKSTTKNTLYGKAI